MRSSTRARPKSWASCAGYLTRPNAKVYELSQLRSPTMPLSPFAGPYQMRPKPTAAIPGTTHAFNSETFNENAEPGQQGTQIDALGHFAVRAQPWDGKSPVEQEKITYYGGLPQSEVGRYYTDEQIEARVFTIKHAYKAARSVTRECIQR